MTEPRPIPLSDVPSLPVIEAQLDRAEISYRDRATSIDSKAGLILGGSGVIIGLVGTSPSVAGLIGQILALVAVITSIVTLWPRVDVGIGAEQLRDRYLVTDEIRTRLALLNTRVLIQQKNEASLFTKRTRLLGAAGLLLSSGTAIAIGGIVDVIRGARG